MGLCQIRKITGAHAPGLLGSFSPPPQVSDPDIHHGTYVTHVSWCKPGSLTSSFFWSRRRGKKIPGIPCACATRSFMYLVRGPYSASLGYDHCFAVVCLLQVTLQHTENLIKSGWRKEWTHIFRLIYVLSLTLDWEHKILLMYLFSVDYPIVVSFSNSFCAFHTVHKASDFIIYAPIWGEWVHLGALLHFDIHVTDQIATHHRRPLTRIWLIPITY